MVFLLCSQSKLLSWLAFNFHLTGFLKLSCIIFPIHLIPSAIKFIRFDADDHLVGFACQDSEGNAKAVDKALDILATASYELGRKNLMKTDALPQPLKWVICSMQLRIQDTSILRPWVIAFDLAVADFLLEALMIFVNFCLCIPHIRLKVCLY